MEPSERLWNYLKEKEGFRQFPYSDQAGNPTIGYGHKILSNESFTKINTAEAEIILKKDAAIAVAAVNRFFTAPLNQNQFDALVSLIYNIGWGRKMANSTIKYWLSGGRKDYDCAAEEFHRWNKITIDGVKRVSNGLVARRLKESEWFLDPVKLPIDKYCNGPPLNVQELTPEIAARIKRDAEHGAGESML